MVRSVSLCMGPRPIDGDAGPNAKERQDLASLGMTSSAENHSELR